MDIHESGRDGSLSEEAGGEDRGINTRWTTAKEELTVAEAPCWNGGVCEKAGSTKYESGEKIVWNRQQRMKIMKDMTKKIRSKGKMDADSRWWVADLLAADCEKAWFHDGWETPCKNGMIGWRR